MTACLQRAVCQSCWALERLSASRRLRAPAQGPPLTELDVENAGGGDGAGAVGGYALEVARVGGVQIAYAQARAVVVGLEGDAAGLGDHGRVVLQPAEAGLGLAQHVAVQVGRLAQRGGDVVHGGDELQVGLCRRGGEDRDTA